MAHGEATESRQQTMTRISRLASEKDRFRCWPNQSATLAVSHVADEPDHPI